MPSPLPLEQDPETVQQEAEGARERHEPRMWARVLAPTLLGLVASVLVMAANTNPGRWLPGSRQGPWIFSFPVLGSAEVPNSVAIAVYYAGLALLGLAWVWILGVATRHRPFPPALALVVFVVWSAPLALAPPVGSDDLASYAATGLLINRGFDPYEVGVEVLGPERAVTATSPFWHDSPQPYGPVFLGVMATASSVTGHRFLRTVMVLRAFALASLALLAVPLVSLARRYGRDPGLVLVSVVCSPLLLVHLVGGAHNEALMLALLAAGLAVGLAGVAAATPRRRIALGLAGVALCGLATGVKLPALLGAAVLGWLWPGSDASVVRRFSGATVATALAGVVVVALSMGSGFGMGWVNNMDVPQKAVTLITPFTAFGVAAEWLMAQVGRPTGPLVPAFRQGGIILGIALAGLCVTRAHRIGPVPALGAALLVLAVSAQTVWPWYFTWGLTFLCIGSVSLWLQVLIVAVNFTVTPLGPPTLGLYYWQETAVAITLVILVAGGVTAATWWRRRAPRRLLPQPLPT